MSIKVHRTKHLEEATKRILEISDTNIEVGWIEAGKRHTDSELSIPHLAQVLEYGATTGRGAVIPPRPMLRTTSSLHGKEWLEDASKISKAVIDGKVSSSGAFEILGETIKTDIQTEIKDSSNWTQNAPSTIKKKGKNTPLIDTHELVDEVKYRIY